MDEGEYHFEGSSEDTNALQITFLVLSGALGFAKAEYVSWENIEKASDFLMFARMAQIRELFTELFGRYLTPTAVESMKAFRQLLETLRAFWDSAAMAICVRKNALVHDSMLEAFAVIFVRWVQKFGFSFACLKCALQCPSTPRDIKDFLCRLRYIFPLEYRDRPLRTSASAEKCFCPDCGAPLQRLERMLLTDIEEAIVSRPLHTSLEGLFMEHLRDLSLSTANFTLFLQTAKVTLRGCEFCATKDVLRNVFRRAHVLLPYRSELLLARGQLAKRMPVDWKAILFGGANKDGLPMLLSFLRTELAPVSQA